MMKLLKLSFLLAQAFVASAQDGNRLGKGPKRGGIVPSSPVMEECDGTEAYFENQVDHFDRWNNQTYRQFYGQSDYYVDPEAEKTLAVIMVGGEGAGFSSGDLACLAWIPVYSYFVQAMVEEGYSVRIYYLEHRYYGRSKLDFGEESSFTAENLRYLSSEQALADLANFISSKRSSDSEPWIAFGGSYPGSLVAWARLKYPHLIAASVASSAPIKPIIDFEGFNDHVASAWANPDAGGSDRCLDIIENGHVQMQEMILNADDDLNYYLEGFRGEQLCEGEAERLNGEDFWALGTSPLISFNLQENKLTCTQPLCNIEHICDALIEAREAVSTDLDALLEVHQQMASMVTPMSQDEDHTLTVHAMTSTFSLMKTSPGSCLKSGEMFGIPYQFVNTNDTDPNNYDRPWNYQTCNEFGWYQTCNEGTHCPYFRGWYPVEVWYVICEVAYGISPERLMQGTEYTTLNYGAWNIDSDRILFMEGAVDPWTAGALPESQSTKEMPVYLVPGASHLEWSYFDDSEPLNEARGEILDVLTDWMKDIEKERT